MSTLFEISEDLIALDRLVEENTTDDGEVNPAVVAVIDEWFATLATNMHEKIDNYAALVTTMLKRAAVRKEESQRLAKRVQVDENQAKYLKQRISGRERWRSNRLDALRRIARNIGP